MSNLQIRPAVPGEGAAIEQVVSAAFGEEPGGSLSRLLRALRAGAAVRASLVAVEDERVVGHVQLNRAWVDARAALVEVAVLSPLAVLPERQGIGIGASLVRAALSAAEELGDPAVFLEGSWDYYGRLGFLAATPLGFTRPSPRIPEPAFQVVIFATHEPWMTGPLVYPDAFWMTDSVGLRDPYLAEVEERVRADDPADGHPGIG